MRQIAVLNESRNRIEKIINYDLQQGQLIDTVEKNIFPLLIDITQIDPRPQIGWLYDGKIFSPPSNPILELEAAMHDYIDAHYPPKWQSFLQMIYMDPKGSENRKGAALAAGEWVKSVVEYYKTLVLRLMDGETLSAEDTDWPTLFDKSDPGVNLLTLPE